MTNALSTLVGEETNNGKELWPHLTAPFTGLIDSFRSSEQIVKFNPVNTSFSHIGPDFSRDENVNDDNPARDFLEDAKWNRGLLP